MSGKGSRKPAQGPRSGVPVWKNPPTSGPHVEWYHSTPGKDGGQSRIVTTRSQVEALTLEGVLVYMDMVEETHKNDPFFKWAFYPKTRWISILKGWWNAPYSDPQY